MPIFLGGPFGPAGRFESNLRTCLSDSNLLSAMVVLGQGPSGKAGARPRTRLVLAKDKDKAVVGNDRTQSCQKYEHTINKLLNNSSADPKQIGSTFLAEDSWLRNPC